MYLYHSLISNIKKNLREKLRNDTAGTSLGFLTQWSNVGHLSDGGVLSVELLVKRMLGVQIVLIEQKVEGIRTNCLRRDHRAGQEIVVVVWEAAGGHAAVEVRADLIPLFLPVLGREMSQVLALLAVGLLHHDGGQLGAGEGGRGFPHLHLLAVVEDHLVSLAVLPFLVLIVRFPLFPLCGGGSGTTAWALRVVFLHQLRLLLTGLGGLQLDLARRHHLPGLRPSDPVPDYVEDRPTLSRRPLANIEVLLNSVSSKGPLANLEKSIIFLWFNRSPRFTLQGSRGPTSPVSSSGAPIVVCWWWSWSSLGTTMVTGHSQLRLLWFIKYFLRRTRSLRSLGWLTGREFGWRKGLVGLLSSAQQNNFRLCREFRRQWEDRGLWGF